MPSVSERVDNLERVLAEYIRTVGNAQMQTERELREFREEMQRGRDISEKEMRAFKEVMQRSWDISEKEMRAFKEVMQRSRDTSEKEMKEFKEEMQRGRDISEKEMKEFKEEMQRGRDISEKEMIEFKEEMGKFKEEMREDRKKAFKQWGDIANKMGTLTEDIVAPSVREIGQKYFDCEEDGEEDFMVRRFRRKTKDRGKRREFDVIAVYEGKVILVEVKSTPRMPYIDDFVMVLKEINEYFPEYKNKKTIPIFASLYLPDEVIAYLTKHDIYAMATRDDMMDLMNFGEIKF